MRLKSTLLFGLLVLFSITAFAQERYVDEVFNDNEITLTSDVHYATNATILPLLFVPEVDEYERGNVESLRAAASAGPAVDAGHYLL